MRFIAFLRAVNVGGRVVKMERLRGLFRTLGFANVETFIASGNVLFDASAKSAKALEAKIEQCLRTALGYEVTTFLRTTDELAAIAAFEPFKKAEIDAATAFNIGFLAAPLDAESEKKVQALTSTVDRFRVHGREVYWLCKKHQSESEFSNALLEKTLGRRSTFRGANTVRKIAALSS